VIKLGPHINKDVNLSTSFTIGDDIPGSLGNLRVIVYGVLVAAKPAACNIMPFESPPANMKNGRGE
jgi:hypothetical protein